MDIACRILLRHHTLPLKDARRNPELANYIHELEKQFAKSPLETPISMKVDHDTTKARLLNLLANHPRPTTLVPGTIGAWLFGCLQQTYGSATSTFSPYCIDSLAWDYWNCNKQVWLLEETTNALQQLHDNDTSPIRQWDSAMVFCPQTFTGFTGEQLQQLQAAKIQYITCLSMVNGKHWVLYPECPLSCAVRSSTVNSNTTVPTVTELSISTKQVVEATRKQGSVQIAKCITVSAAIYYILFRWLGISR